jgi:hypothetical protein
LRIFLFFSGGESTSPSRGRFWEEGVPTGVEREGEADDDEGECFSKAAQSIGVLAGVTGAKTGAKTGALTGVLAEVIVTGAKSGAKTGALTGVLTGVLPDFLAGESLSSSSCSLFASSIEGVSLGPSKDIP